MGGYWANPEWAYVEACPERSRGRRAVAPTGAETVRIKLFGQMTSGWITYDDVSLRSCDGGGVQAAPSDTALDPAERDLARAGRVMSPEEALSRQQPRWRYEDIVECEDPGGCPEAAVEEPMEVRWAPVSEVDREIGRSLMGDLMDEGGETQSAPQSGGSVVVKRYVFAGQVIAMRHDGELYFLRPDHLGSASLIQDDTGRWLADHRFYPYGETRRSDGASESYPTDRLFTGMMLRERLGIYRMGARWYDGQIGRWISPDTIIPDFADPQSLNRYSYVLNRPLTLTDPSGHIASEEEEESLALIGQLCDAYGVCIEVDFGYVPYESPGPDAPSWMWVKGQWELHQLVALRDTAEYANQLYDRYQAGEITSLDVLCNLIDYRASIGSPETFVDDLSTFILGERGGRAVWAPPLHASRWSELKLDDSGFSAYHQDDSNQARHFWMYAHAAYTTGKPRLVTVGNWLHERKWLPGIGGPGASRQDYILGNKGRDLGMALREGTVDFSQASDWIRREAGDRN